MLGYIPAQGHGSTNRLLADLVARLEAAHWPLAGAVQINTTGPENQPCQMMLRVIGHDNDLCITQNLGPHATGCRLDTQALETAVGLVAASLAASPALLVVNKFGKAEAEGHGFRAVIGNALALDIPVLLTVHPPCMDNFLTYTDGLAEELLPDLDRLQDWCCEQTGRSAQNVSLARTVP
ncbi:DUF2478 domain-containing protein [Roseinatronobacter sp.]